LLFVERDQIAWQVVGDWNGLGLRGNRSSPMIFNGVVPEDNRLGIGHDDEPIMPKYLMPLLILTYGAAYRGIASGAYDLACQEGDKCFPRGARRLDSPINQRRIAEMSAQIEAAVRVTQDLMTMFGSTAFAARLPFERDFRDARAGVVMGVANDQAYEMIGTILFPKP
jgi:alkylation response protein AidB-like acyl-CoA dehydrogenase